MFVAELTQKIDAWMGDPTPFIQVPLNGRTLSRSESYDLVHQLANVLRKDSSSNATVGFCFDDPANWILAVIAAQIAGAVAVPIPKEFTGVQISSFVPNLNLILTDSKALANKLSELLGPEAIVKENDVPGSGLFLMRGASASCSRLRLPSNAVGVIHTSGSTDNPKGVVISDDGLLSVVRSMSGRLRNLKEVRYASVLPMSLLLEQILGIFIPIFQNGSISVLPPSIPCYTGTQPDLLPYLETIKQSRANFAMVPPSFLAELAKRSAANGISPRDCVGPELALLATGGAPIEPATLRSLKDGGLDVFQGYGLSENTSVVAWTYPGPNSLGSVGTPLTHNEVRITNDGEVEVKGSALFLGYVSRGEFAPRNEAWLRTGDQGFFDEQGCLHITGRDSNLIVLSSGRNVSPEWVEGKFKSIPSVKDVLLVGHGRPFLSAIILVNKGIPCEVALGTVERFAGEINNGLPEFSRVRAFRALPFDDRYYSVSGRVLRKQVMEAHKSVVDEIYLSMKV